MKKSSQKDVDALGSVLAAVKDLDDVQRKWVFASAMSNLGLHAPASSTLGPQSAIDTSKPSGMPKTDGEVSPKQFLRSKDPRSDVQRVACLAYYLNHYRDQPHFKTRDLTALNVDAAGTTIGNIAQAVANATRQNHYFAPAGGGKKQITLFGEEVVDALPDQDAVKNVEKNKPKKRRARKGTARVRNQA